MELCVDRLERPPDADRILVVRLGAVGDVVRTLPAVSALRSLYPGAHLAWLVEPASASALEGQPCVDEVVVFPRGELAALVRRGRWLAAAVRGLRFARELRRRRFDLALDFHGIAKSALLVRLSGARERVGYARPYAREASWLLATRRVRLRRPRVSRYARNFALVESLGGRAESWRQPFHVARERRDAIEQHIGRGRRPILLHPGTSPQTPHKRWPAPRFAALARQLAADGHVVWVTRGPSDDERAGAERIVAASAGAAALAPETPDLGTLAALLAAGRVFVSGDTGPLHIASLVGTPVVQLLGPTDPIENAPAPQAVARTLRVPVACSPCRRGCAAAPCMHALPVEQVAQAVRSLLAAREPGC